MAELIKSFLVPGSISFFAAGMIVGVALLYAGERIRRWARIWLTCLLVVYLFLATPLGADWVAGPLVRSFTPIATADQARGITTMVVLSTGGEVYRAYGEEVDEMGKSTAYNALEAARLYRLVKPTTIIASGGIVEPGSRRESEAAVLAGGLVRLGVPRDRIILESSSRNTHDQAVNVARMLQQRGVQHFLLVTGADHMPRANASFRELGLRPLPAVSLFAMATPESAWHRLRPSINALKQSDWACYEYLARIYYWKQAWLTRE